MPTFYQLLSGIQKQKINRLSRVMREGSPKYRFTVTTGLAAGAWEGFDINRQFPRAAKYQPLDSCRVINNDAVDIAITFNGRADELYFIVPAGTIRRISREEVAAIWNVIITNLDAAAVVVANMINCEFWRSPEDADSVARQDYNGKK